VSVARIFVEPLAKQDIREARDWYSEKGQGLSELFRDELIAVFDFIARQPPSVRQLHSDRRDWNECVDSRTSSAISIIQGSCTSRV
jgi:plasmid stabilization system protein ParE